MQDHARRAIPSEGLHFPKQTYRPGFRVRLRKALAGFGGHCLYLTKESREEFLRFYITVRWGKFSISMLLL